MARTRQTGPSSASSSWGKFDPIIMLLQGGALGAYQAGIHASFGEADWIAGVSIGSINAART